MTDLSIRCRVEFKNYAASCRSRKAWSILEEKFGPGWVIDFGFSGSKEVEAQLFESKLREEGELLVWSSKKKADRDVSAEEVDAVVIAVPGYIVETPLGDQRVATLPAAAHVAASRGWFKIRRDSISVQHLTKREQEEFVQAVSEHDSRRAKPLPKPAGK